ncbi:MAG: DUF349 domain-containing protein [Prevotella sp.]|nr:DUF349 domain-containing protein [Prevotella sp.]MDY6092908.1 DUF349 domain-containing protein [Prevotella sp.]
MDSQEKAPEMGMEKLQAEAVQEEQVVNEPQQVVADEVKEKKVYASKKEVVERVKEIAHGEENPQKEEVDYLKMMFYKLLVTEREATLKDYIEKGGDPETYQVIPDEDEEVFKAEMAVIKERRAQLFKQQEEEKEKNLKRKLEIIERIKSMITSPEEANQSFQEFKALQQEWKEIKNVPAPQVSELWRNYQLYVEQFYDLLKLNSEAREYDFKKNLETKTRLCEAAEKLAEQDDLISAFYQLQELHQEYRETGPVAKEMREEIWARFKAASTVINKRHQQHFEQLRAKEEENLVKKTELCEKAEALLAEERKGSADWERHTKEMIEIQTEWKTIGFAPQKMNVKIFERFRAACDSFFEKKAAYFKELKENFKINAEKKRALIAKANELKDSQEWRSTSDKLIALQKEWKTIGAVPKKLGDQLWEEFLAACNHFFEARNAAGAGQRSEEHGNLEKKRDVIARLKALQESAADNLQEAVQQLVDEYGQIGHVPFKEKDKLYAEYHETLNALYRTLNVNVAKRRLNNFKNKLKTVAEQGGNALDNERARLVRQYETLKQEVQTYENNLCFLSVSSKKGNSLIDEMNRKVQKLKDDMNLVLEKIKAIDNQ